MIKTIYKRFDLKVTEAAKTVSQSFELDKNIVAVKGLYITSDRRDILYFRGSQRIEINKDELFPENYLSELLMSGLNVPVNLRYYDLGNVDPGNKIVKMDFADSNSSVPFAPYTVSLFLKCDKDDSK
ncbi:MAG: hypothetical protein HY841_00920 [Bacteroidetes bacterium]|nr:hypothetical protein [Bacteroidota bacterium]